MKPQIIFRPDWVESGHRQKRKWPNTATTLSFARVKRRKRNREGREVRKRGEIHKHTKCPWYPVGHHDCLESCALCTTRGPTFGFTRKTKPAEEHSGEPYLRKMGSQHQRTPQVIGSRSRFSGGVGRQPVRQPRARTRSQTSLPPPHRWRLIETNVSTSTHTDGPRHVPCPLSDAGTKTQQNLESR